MLIAIGRSVDAIDPTAAPIIAIGTNTIATLYSTKVPVDSPLRFFFSGWRLGASYTNLIKPVVVTIELLTPIAYILLKLKSILRRGTRVEPPPIPPALHAASQKKMKIIENHSKFSRGQKDLWEQRSVLGLQYSHGS